MKPKVNMNIGIKCRAKIRLKKANGTVKEWVEKNTLTDDFWTGVLANKEQFDFGMDTCRLYESGTELIEKGKESSIKNKNYIRREICD